MASVVVPDAFSASEDADALFKACKGTCELPAPGMERAMSPWSAPVRSFEFLDSSLRSPLVSG